ncbi:MAG: hypothetical protein ACUVQI_04585 [Thermochromatium sp.]
MEPEPGETRWRIGDADAGLPADLGPGFIALPATACTLSETTATEMKPAAGPLTMPTESAPDAPTADTETAEGANTAQRRSLTISLKDQTFHLS